MTSQSRILLSLLLVFSSFSISVYFPQRVIAKLNDPLDESVGWMPLGLSWSEGDVDFSISHFFYINGSTEFFMENRCLVLLICITNKGEKPILVRSGQLLLRSKDGKEFSGDQMAPARFRLESGKSRKFRCLYSLPQEAAASNLYITRKTQPTLHLELPIPVSERPLLTGKIEKVRNQKLKAPNREQFEVKPSETSGLE